MKPSEYALRRVIQKAKRQHRDAMLMRRLDIPYWADNAKLLRDATLRRARVMQKSLREVQP